MCLRESTVERDDWARCPTCDEPQFICHLTCPKYRNPDHQELKHHDPPNRPLPSGQFDSP